MEEGRLAQGPEDNYMFWWFQSHCLHWQQFVSIQTLNFKDRKLAHCWCWWRETTILWTSRVWAKGYIALNNNCVQGKSPKSTFQWQRGYVYIVYIYVFVPACLHCHTTCTFSALSQKSTACIRGLTFRQKLIKLILLNYFQQCMQQWCFESEPSLL